MSLSPGVLWHARFRSSQTDLLPPRTQTLIQPHAEIHEKVRCWNPIHPPPVSRCLPGGTHAGKSGIASRFLQEKQNHLVKMHFYDLGSRKETGRRQDWLVGEVGTPRKDKQGSRWTNKKKQQHAGINRTHFNAYKQREWQTVQKQTGCLQTAAQNVMFFFRPLRHWCFFSYLTLWKVRTAVTKTESLLIHRRVFYAWCLEWPNVSRVRLIWIHCFGFLV